MINGICLLKDFFFLDQVHVSKQDQQIQYQNI